MGKVTADAYTLGMPLRGSAVGTGVLVSELQVVMNVVTDRLHALPASIDAGESRPRQIGKFLSVAVAAAQKIRQRLIRQSADNPLLRIGDDCVGLATVADDEVAPDFQQSRRGDEPRAGIAKGIQIIMGLDPVRAECGARSKGLAGGRDGYSA